MMPRAARAMAVLVHNDLRQGTVPATLMGPGWQHSKPGAMGFSINCQLMPPSLVGQAKALPPPRRRRSALLPWAPGGNSRNRGINGSSASSWHNPAFFCARVSGRSCHPGKQVSARAREAGGWLRVRQSRVPAVRRQADIAAVRPRSQKSEGNARRGAQAGCFRDALLGSCSVQPRGARTAGACWNRTLESVQHAVHEYPGVGMPGAARGTITQRARVFRPLLRRSDDACSTAQAVEGTVNGRSRANAAAFSTPLPACQLWAGPLSFSSGEGMPNEAASTIVRGRGGHPVRRGPAEGRS